MIGIISDTHDNVLNIRKAVKVFQEKNVDFVIHLGDIISPTSTAFFKGVKVKFIKGNCDGDLEMIKKKAEEIGSEFLGNSVELAIKGRKLVGVHGDNALILNKLINSGKYAYVLHGHTHIKRDEVIGNTRVINPGAHYWGAEDTIALLDVGANKLEFIKL